MESVLKRDRPTIKQLFLDPRSKMLLCITAALINLAGGSDGVMGYVKIGLAIIPLLFMVVLGKPLVAAYYVGLYVFSLWLPVVTRHLPPALNACVTGIIVTSTQAIPSMAMVCFMVATTTVSEFMAAMDRLHVPKKVTIPISSMFRFFPTIKEEYSAIKDAMTLRGVGAWSNPLEMLEFRLVPLMTELLSINNELAASALTRGLDAPNKRENVCPIGFHIQDYLVVLLCVGIVVLKILCNIYGW